MKKLGIALIITGFLLLLINGVNIVSREKIIDFGKIEVYQEEIDPLVWSPYIGVAFLIVGISVLVLIGGSSKTPAKF